MRYLLVDDDSAFRERLSLALSKCNNHVTTASNAKEARELARKNNIERAIVDLRMPGNSGLELISWLKADHPNLVIVVLTGYGSIATTQEAIRRGAISYLTKPAQLERIIGAFNLSQSKSNLELPVPTLYQVEWEHLQRVLSDCAGNVTRAARVLGMDRRSLQRRLAKTPRLK